VTKFLKNESSKNAGDWAELYVLLMTLAQGKLYAADGDLNLIHGQFFPVISIEMQKEGQAKENPINIIYTVNINEQVINVMSEGFEKQISMATFMKESKRFFEIISTRKGRSFKVPEISPLLEKLNNPVTKQSSSKKADIHIVIHDMMTGFKSEVGFSIKSKHSSSASLINASGQTLFQYHIHCKDVQKGLGDARKALLPFEPIELHNENKLKKIGPKERVAKLLRSGYQLSFSKMKSAYFQENLQLIDSSLDLFLSDCLLVFMQKKISSLADVVELVAKRNPCGYVARDEMRLLDFYQYKMKRLIVDAALGMQPKNIWTGKYDASGGYIIVKSSGEVVCYHLYNWNALQDYLYKNLKFETPTSTGSGNKKSFNYALYYCEGGEPYMDICLQLRFK
jgi:type II restriction enzyme